MTEDQLQRAITLDRQLVALRAHIKSLDHALMLEYPPHEIELGGIEDRYVTGAIAAVNSYFTRIAGELQREFDTL